MVYPAILILFVSLSSRRLQYSYCTNSDENEACNQFRMLSVISLAAKPCYYKLVHVEYNHVIFYTRILWPLRIWGELGMLTR